jgi:hypothetical protein
MSNEKEGIIVIALAVVSAIWLIIITLYEIFIM